MRLGESLSQLAEVESRLEALAAEVAVARARAAGDPTLAELERRSGELEQSVRHASAGLRQIELEVEGLEERAKSQERSIYDGSVRNPTDLQRRQHQLQSLREQISGREEVELAEMEGQERLTAELAQARAAVAERAEELARLRREDAARAPQLEAEMATAATEHEQILGELPPAALLFYRRIAARRNPPVAMVVGGICSGCRLPLPHRLLEEARHDALVTCENCERILVL
ncbi:MAG: zinc ribbon domain-containing protein [Candidatus Dormibacteria bacterium]